MNRNVCLTVAVLGSALVLYGEDAGKGKAMTGWVCNSECVVQGADRATCDQSCNKKGGDAVFVDDQGNVLKITGKYQEMAKKHMAKHMKIRGTMDEQQTEMERIQFLYEQAP